MEVSPFHIEEVMSEEESFARLDGRCDVEVIYHGTRSRCPGVAEVIIKVESNNGFAINCSHHAAEYLVQTGLVDCYLMRYTEQRVLALLAIARERGWHNELVTETNDI